MVNGSSGTIAGTPSAAGSFSASILAYQFANAQGDAFGPLTLVFTISPAATVPPTITTSPASQSVNVGASITFSTAASGTPAPTYQWKKNNVDVSGANASSLTLTGVQPGDAATYTVVATNSAGSATSGSAVLTVIIPAVAPTLSLHPITQSVAAGGVVTFIAAASGTPAPSFQWLKNGTPMAGATAATLTLASVQTADAGTYSLVATNSAGSVTSNGAQLTVIIPPAAPTILVQPASQAVVVGQAVTFVAVASGNPTPSGRWRKDGADLAGATGNSLVLANAQPADAGSYTFVATNSAGSATSSAAILRVNPAPAAPLITSQPVSQSAPGSSVTFTVAAAGTPAPTFQWLRSGVNIAGATAATLTQGLQPADAGTFTVVVTNEHGTATSMAAVLTVLSGNSAPVFVTGPSSRTANVGDSISLSAVIGGAPTPRLQWQKNGTDIAGAIGSTLTIAPVQPSDAGNYTLVATNLEGTAVSQVAVLTVELPVGDAGRLVNLSILTDVTPEAGSFTVGAVIGGAGTEGAKPLLIRAAGPALERLGVADFLGDPKLELFAGAVKIAENDNWGIDPQVGLIFTQVGAFPFASSASKDAAVYNPAVARGDVSIRVSGFAGTSGSVIAELYDATPAGAFHAATPRLINVSVLKPVGAGLTAGFVIGGVSPMTVLVRAVGPSLAGFGVSAPLADPRLELFDATGRSIAANDNWGGAAALGNAFNQVGAFMLDAQSKDAALVSTLSPGNYTVRITGASSGDGVGLVEIYEVR